ncbi:ABC transporter permease [Virgibacillus sp. MSJ-26]|uniref:ABC transporter permease n=1 Tax=Virgibacillus sp. MSJ-26 TaxID=2841522 RepID=UPI001C10E1B4|nr:ABC transporter permease subunit [Virgibacillus sp. MSJ-26]MBU5468156.1 ABC transporter permease [Virgibacillus sp. MSJ-26]
MTQWLTLFRKEMSEYWRNLKWIWVPLVIILLAIMDPITSYYLPQIIELSGDLPEGSTFDLPTPSPPEAIMMSLSQLSSLGALILILISMGSISGEQQTGITEMILVKPVSFANYVLAKWAALVLLIWVSLILGILASWYYTNILFGSLSFISFIQIVCFYGLWLTLVATISIFYNTLVKSPGFVAFLTISTLMVMSIITQLFGSHLKWSPNNLSNHINEMLIFNEVSISLIATALVTLCLIVILLIGSFSIFKTKELGK